MPRALRLAPTSTGNPSASWFPRVVGIGALLLALVYAIPCVLVPYTAGDQVVLGYRVVGSAGWLASALHAVFFFWLGYACLRRQLVAAWALIGYCVYLIENIWIYSTGEGLAYFRSGLSMVIVNSVVTAILLTFCRVVLRRRAAFAR